MTQPIEMRPSSVHQSSSGPAALAAWRRLWILLLAEPDDSDYNENQSPDDDSEAESNSDKQDVANDY